jgi:hypothetical protein
MMMRTKTTIHWRELPLVLQLSSFCKCLVASSFGARQFDRLYLDRLTFPVGLLLTFESRQPYQSRSTHAPYLFDHT